MKVVISAQGKKKFVLLCLALRNLFVYGWQWK